MGRYVRRWRGASLEASANRGPAGSFIAPTTKQGSPVIQDERCHPMPIRGISSSEPLGVVQKDQRYDSTTIWLHWMTVILVAILWILGQVTGWLPRGPFRLGVWSTHVVLGLILVLGARDAHPVAGGLWERLAAGRHGCVAFARKGHPLRSLSGASCRSHFGDRQCILYGFRSVWRFDYAAVRQRRSGNRAQHQHIAGVGGESGGAIAFFHATAALGHQYIWRDRLLQRMRPHL